LFYSEEKRKWLDTKFFFGATLFSRLENDVQSYCLEDYGVWSFYNDSKMEFTENLVVNCSKIEEVCCHQVEISSTNAANTSFYGDANSKTLGTYKAIGTQQGRYLYQKPGEDRFLEYGDRYWLVSTGVGKTSGHLNHVGGSVCPEHLDVGWKISTLDEQGSWDWTEDAGLRVDCLPEAAPTGLPHVRLEHRVEGREGLVAERRHELQAGHHITRDGHPAGHHQAGGGGTSSTVLAVLLLIALLAMAAFFTNRFHKAWGRGAQGKRLLTETFLE
jgi:hypothetical protein